MARPKSLNLKQNISLSIDKVILAKIKKVSNEKKKTLSGFTEEHYRDFLETIEAMKKDPIVYNKEMLQELDERLERIKLIIKQLNKDKAS